MIHPSLCRPQAFHFFAAQLRNLDTTEGLLNAATAVCMHAVDGVAAESIRIRLSGLSHRVRRRVRGKQPQALLAHLHDVLFEEEHFHGNSQDYYNPSNSYLSTVLATRRGIPVTLCLVYKVVAEGVGLKVEGVNMPGHFLTRVKLPDGPMIVDPFFGGTALTETEAFDRAEQVTGRPLQRSLHHLAAASHGQWVSRILVNLQHIFAASDRRRDLAAMSELQSLLDYSLY